MKFFVKVILFILLLTPCAVNAASSRTVVIPADIDYVCENYYCFPEVSELIAYDVITYLNKTNQVNAPSMYDIRAKLAVNPQLKTLVRSAANKYRFHQNVDYTSMKAIAHAFSAKSVLMITSYIQEENSKRGIWEVLEVASSFNIVHSFKLVTNAVLIDTVNDIPMWSGTYTKTLGNRNEEFTAKSYAQANARLEEMRMYSKNIVAKTIAQNVILRFFPKSIRPVNGSTEVKKNEQMDGSFFRINKSNPAGIKRQENDEVMENYGEILYGI